MPFHHFIPNWYTWECSLPVLWTSATTVLGWYLLITAVISERYIRQNYTSTVPNALRETVLKIPYCFTLCKDVLPSFRWLNIARERILSMYNNMLFVSSTAGSWARLRLDHIPTTKKRSRVCLGPELDHFLSRLLLWLSWSAPEITVFTPAQINCTKAGKSD